LCFCFICLINISWQGRVTLFWNVCPACFSMKTTISSKRCSGDPAFKSIRQRSSNTSSAVCWVPCKQESHLWAMTVLYLVPLCCWILVEHWAVAVVPPLVEAYNDHRMLLLPIHETTKMNPLECKSASIASSPPGGLGIVGPKLPTKSIPSNDTLYWLTSSWSS
jgi:hypothetical protein